MPDPQFNALKHGCTARTPVLPGEDESLWREVERDWFHDYEPQTNTSRTMVAEAALAFWFLARNRHQLESYQRTLPRDPVAWTEEHHTHYAHFTRYKTAAERTFSNAFKNLEYLRKARLSEAAAQRQTSVQLEKLQFQMARDTERLNIAAAKMQLDREKHAATERHRAAAKETKPSPSSPAKKNKKDDFDVAEQWMEITITAGLTKTEYIPTNEELLAELEKEGRVPKMVYRRMYFPDGVPPEYTWTNLHDVQTCRLTQANQWCEPCARYLNGGAGMQRMTFDTWQAAIAREALTPGQHAGPTGSGNLQRPKEREGDVPFDEMLTYLATLQPGNDGDRLP